MSYTSAMVIRKQPFAIYHCLLVTPRVQSPISTTAHTDWSILHCHSRIWRGARSDIWFMDGWIDGVHAQEPVNFLGSSYITFLLLEFGD
jgi:hypothetical protein